MSKLAKTLDKYGKNTLDGAFSILDNHGDQIAGLIYLSREIFKDNLELKKIISEKNDAITELNKKVDLLVSRSETKRKREEVEEYVAKKIKTEEEKPEPPYYILYNAITERYPKITEEKKHDILFKVIDEIYDSKNRPISQNEWIIYHEKAKKLFLSNPTKYLPKD